MSCSTPSSPPTRRSGWRASGDLDGPGAAGEAAAAAAAVPGVPAPPDMPVTPAGAAKATAQAMAAPTRPEVPPDAPPPPAGDSAAAWREWAAAALARAGVPSPRREAALLLGHATGRGTAWAWAAGAGDALSEEARRRLADFVRRRAARLPFAYVVGTVEFADVRLRVAPGVLVPRPETETLLEAALSLAPDGVPLRLADLGSGSGALAVALARRRPRAEIWAVDASPRALACAAANALEHGARDRVRCLLGDWWTAFSGHARAALPLDGAVCNPPYLTPEEWRGADPEVRAEPVEALVGGPTGLEAFDDVLAGVPGRLRPGGFLAFEVGAGQAGAVAARMRARGFTAVRAARDLAGHERVVMGVWEGAGACGG
ncbi:MAG: peptide chain release factor N(5)-glutamine methyltransferase [Firmicutes bacterium]|nr:peptide chain release factor N(5)-glutamine methyltransferase [Bacillota bacterium]